MFNIFFFFENHAFYEIMWKNIVEPGGPQITVFNTYGFSAAIMVAGTHLNATLYEHCLPGYFCL